MSFRNHWSNVWWNHWIISGEFFGRTPENSWPSCPRFTVSTRNPRDFAQTLQTTRFGLLRRLQTLLLQPTGIGSALRVGWQCVSFRWNLQHHCTAMGFRKNCIDDLQRTGDLGRVSNLQDTYRELDAITTTVNWTGQAIKMIAVH